jgi:hypothetical protein
MTNDVKFEKSEKRLLWVFGLFALIILVSQVLQFTNSRNNENEYRKMLVSRMIVVETSQKIMVETTAIHRSLLNLLIAAKPGEIENFRDISSSSFLEMQREIETIDKNIFTTAQSDKKTELAALTKEYEQLCKQFLSLLETDNAKALEYKNTAIRPAFEKCQLAQTELVNILNNDLQSESDKLTSASTTSSIVILLLGISPFLLFALYFLFQSSRIVYYEFFS